MRPDTANLHQEPPRRAAPERGGDFAIALWHPQWGGYCFPCVVEWGAPHGFGAAGSPDTAGPFSDLPCFDVHEFHDGDFPTDERVSVRHYCDAAQVVTFGMQVIEAQCRESAVSPSLEWMRDMRARLDALIRRYEEACQ